MNTKLIIQIINNTICLTSEAQEAEGAGLGLREEDAAEAPLMATRVNQTAPLGSEIKRLSSILLFCLKHWDIDVPLSLTCRRGDCTRGS